MLQESWLSRVRAAEEGKHSHSLFAIHASLFPHCPLFLTSLPHVSVVFPLFFSLPHSHCLISPFQAPTCAPVAINQRQMRFQPDQ